MSADQAGGGPCWAIESDPWEEPHFPRREAALKRAAEDAAEAEREPHRVFRHAEVCITVSCRECGYSYGESDYGCAMHVLRSEIKPTQTDIAGELFRVGEDWLCEECRDGLPPAAPHVPGQLALLGGDEA